MEILTINGQVIQTITDADKEITLDLSNLSAGVYIIKAMTSKGITIRKFIRE